MSQIEFIGHNSIQNIEKHLNENNFSKVFVVRGKHSYSFSGAEGLLAKYLKSKKVTEFSDYSENPKLEDVVRGTQLFRSIDPDLVITVGGGSAIDIGKLINYLAMQDGEPRKILLDNISNFKKGKPHIAIPTTSGSGSEATHFAVLYFDNVKYSVSHPAMMPDIAIVDSQFTFSLPPHQTSVSGIDAFCQAIESFWSVNSTEESKEYAVKAIEMIIKNLPHAVDNPNISNRENMSIAAHLAGKAINISKTTAPHALSYTMTSLFGVSHGQAVALTLPQFLEFNYYVSEKSLLDKRGLNYVKETMEQLLTTLRCATIEEGKIFLEKFITGVGLSVNMSDCGITRNDIDVIIQNVNIERLQNNPRTVSEHDLKMLLKRVSR